MDWKIRRAAIRESVLTSNTTDITCVSFSGRVGERCGCRIYANRPEECREFEVGSEQCADARRIAGI